MMVRKYGVCYLCDIEFDPPGEIGNAPVCVDCLRLAKDKDAQIAALKAQAKDSNKLEAPWRDKLVDLLGDCGPGLILEHAVHEITRLKAEITTLKDEPKANLCDHDWVGTIKSSCFSNVCTKCPAAIRGDGSVFDPQLEAWQKAQKDD